MRASLLLLSPLVAAALLVACGGAAVPARDATTARGACPPASLIARLAPPSGVYFGVNLDWGRYTAKGFAAQLGRPPAVYVAFAPFPIDASAGGYLDDIVGQVKAAGGMLMLTLEPNGGLASVDADAAATLAERLAGYNQRGVPVFLRFAHEMNGSWYAWSQQPWAYVEAFQTIAAAVHARADATAMVWAPNYGGGYPFTGGKYEAQPGTPAFTALDTNGDGVLTMADDPYAPYFPGSDAVDWVGMSLYHWGSAYPWGENEMPEPDKLAEQLTGTYDGANGDDTAVPDFYAEYAQLLGKPLALTETAALYAPATDGISELALKQAWWRQVFSADTHGRFPWLQMINWFEWDKYETETRSEIDWTVASKPAIRDAFVADLPDYLRFGSTDGNCN
jgi:Glycosyl hydrolase family 26